MRAFLSALALCMAWGCAAPQGAMQQAKLRDPGIFLLPPKEAGVELSVTQSLLFIKGASRLEALAVVEVGKDAVSLVGLGPLGNRILGLRWDGSHLEKERDPHLPKELPLELILRDLQLAFWPLQALRQAIQAKGWTLEDDGTTRILSQGTDTVVRIRYGGLDRWHSLVTFEHLGLGYTLEIHPIKDED